MAETDWQNKFVDIKSRNSHMLKTQQFVDCSFLVGDEKKVFKAHKVILASASPVFEKMFYGNLKEPGYQIAVTDVQPKNFEFMLNYIYTDNIHFNTYKDAIDQYYIAEKYMLSVLVNRCVEYIYNNLTIDNACECYEFAEFYNRTTLKQRSMQLIIANTQTIITRPNFNKISFSMLMTILDQEQLNINSELSLFNALERYAKERVVFKNKHLQVNKQKTVSKPNPINGQIVNGCPIKVIDSNKIKKPSIELIDEEVFKNAVKKIRFLTMTPQQFADGPARSILLKQDEAFKFFTLICTTNKNDKTISVPDGFSSSNLPRHNCNINPNYGC